jgi:predicted nucleic acid-binding protein
MERVGPKMFEAGGRAPSFYIVTCDKNLLALEKPFGIETIRPAEFLRRIKA